MVLIRVKWTKMSVEERILPVVNIPKFHMLSGGMGSIAANPIVLEIVDEST